MKRMITLAALLMMTITAWAQPQGRGPQGREFPMPGPQFEQRDPAQVAQEQTDRLNDLVGLTDKQYKKIFKFNQKMERQRQNEMENMMPMGRPEGFPEGMGPGMGGGRPECPMGQGRPEGMGPGGMPPRGDGQFRPRPMNEDMQQMMEKQQEKRVKKYRKVLTPEQYQKWESFEAERNFLRMVESPR